ncbi:preprotein translocase subunit SecG [Novosphingobium sp. G106]|uniref:preprotein translocase subunit SecG n=1 Tax=Novosphingobium sp. G106 TaxID=2849500 RepID=UPI001C2D991E|nr:preprotein translocase subunit SecG [Novosphingobium sp. G106]MBV1687123.1 preprotein translocase subunit SecG [Novosphingobium sp. G106]
MSIFIFLTVVQALVGAALVGVILMQRSEGGGLGVGSSSASFMSARGAADFLTRSTAVLATIFVLLSIVLAALAASGTESRKIDTTLDRSAPVAPAAPVDPLAGAAQPGAPAQGTPAPAAPQPAPANDPLAGTAKK